MKQLGRVAAGAVALALVWSGPVGGQQQVDRGTLEPHIVRVVVKAAQATAASGFVWLAPNQVVTSLHAVPEGAITVTCLGESLSASVSKVLVRADLALLTTTPKGFSRCRPVTQAFEQKPQPGSPLFTLGSFQNATITSRSMTKEFASLETLNGLVTGATLNALKRFNSPATDLDIYYVQSGALPGYSGGPVFDPSGRLVGIVDGGLNKGQDGYNWVIPARHLSDLMASTVTQVPPFLVQSSAELFSAKLAEDDTAAIPAAGGGRGGSSGMGGVPSRLLRTKTLSLAQLARTSDDPAAITGLLKEFKLDQTETQTEMNRKFDIYEESEWDVIFAAPEKAKVEWNPAGKRYRIQLPAGGIVSINYFAQGTVSAADGTGLVKASDPRYFQEVIAFAIGECEHPVVSPIMRKGCELDAPTVRMIDFGNGNKILKFGYLDWNRDPKNYRYKYRVTAVRGEASYAAVFEDVSGDTDDLSGVFSLNLITFPNLRTPGKWKPFLDTQLDYDDSTDNDDTIGAKYYENKLWKFYNARGKVWSIPLDGGRRTEVVEQRRDANFVYLKGTPNWFAVPINGGSYSVSTDQGKTWQKAGSVVRMEPQ